MNPRANFLEEIIERKQLRLQQAQAERPLAIVCEAAKQMRRDQPRHALRRALETDAAFKVIAEIKRASPSRGVIKQNFDPIELARAYARGGAVAISVLTEEDYFQGSLGDLRGVRQVNHLPILRKDFIVDEYQLYESAEAGADALLLIVAALTDEQLARFRRVTEEELGMDALVEVHTLDELRRAQLCGATLIGVNNRNLRTFEVSLSVSVDLACDANAGTVLVSESGLQSRRDLQRLQALGYKGFLIGEALMRTDDPATALRTLTQGSTTDAPVRIKICGITNLRDALACVREGVDMLGFNFYRDSPRYIPPEHARKIIEQLPRHVMSVGVFVNEESPETVASIAGVAGVAAIQLHGDESPLYCRGLKDRFVIKALRVHQNFEPQRLSEYETDAILLDAFSSNARGGTGKQFDWSVAQQARQYTSKLFLAGGITPDNVKDAVEVVRPYALDVCSGVEIAPGRKDEQRVREFIAAARASASEAALTK